MCLEYVTQEFDPPITAEIVVWKILRTYPGDKHLYPPMQGSEQLVRGAWYGARRRDLLTEMGNARWYSSGFHCFRSCKAAHEFKGRMWRNPDETLVILQIKARGLRTVGTQYGHEVLVVDEIMVPLVVNGVEIPVSYHIEVM